MTPIDMTTWPRTGLFRSYLGTDFPYINLGVRMEVSRLVEQCRREGNSFYFSLIHLATQTADEIEHFHYRFCGEQAYRIERNVPVLTHLHGGEETFMMLEGPLTEDRAEFCRILRKKADNTPPGVRLDNGDRLDLISFSCLPWVDYTHVVRSITRFGKDCNPKMTWGKYVTENGKTTLNFTVQVHHGMMDGYHVALFFQNLQEKLDSI